jgi:hypothetical protein
MKNNKPSLNTMENCLNYKIKMKSIFIILIGLFLISFVSADCSLPSSKIGDTIQLTQTCSNCTYVNITKIVYPNQSIALLGEYSMDANGTNYNYSYIPNTLGNYYYTTKGDLNGIVTVQTCSFGVTPNGLSQSTSQGIGSAIFLILMIILMFVFGFLGFKLFKTENLWVLGIFFMFLSGMFLVYNTWLGYEYHRLFTGLTDSSIPETIYYIFLLILVLGSLTSVALLILHWKKIFKYIKQEIKRKEGDDKDTEDWDMDSWGGKDFGK